MLLRALADHRRREPKLGPLLTLPLLSRCPAPLSHLWPGAAPLTRTRGSPRSPAETVAPGDAAPQAAGAAPPPPPLLRGPGHTRALAPYLGGSAAREQLRAWLPGFIASGVSMGMADLEAG